MIITETKKILTNENKVAYIYSSFNDKTGNSSKFTYSEEESIKILEELDSKGNINCKECFACKECTNCTNCFSCENCIECIDCANCSHGCKRCKSCANCCVCKDSDHLLDCVCCYGCSRMVGMVGIRSLEYRERP